mmetsp:Transcript_40302/g.89508  ORF Transcript_40302/g.89508 Transcript_40302/m.89508 type:complete len:219 (+) Transcript_40302:57-713(+)|eukprot:CAMPEP_0202901308 /NCGR_PEP_ID=MMETSP1392-20130828/14184_1 /ASSEMBLY_ACC=CAM_ASM_000868 /TAXON_ID=225041 /ORGANISM="Chlamydomonas chlamydogama, Strain SAG 11-48b" /LENGTH=218 /DNA_ID=CAMNT_0049587855 /DNA_START=51 /DNA_END=707 /DNA_ORIENTATION=-
MADVCTAVQSVKVVGICGSLREGGFTRQALELALQGASEALCEVELIDLSEYNLYFCDGLEFQSKNAKVHTPNDVAKLKAKVTEAKGIILATPEYHNSFSGVLKNALDLLGFDEFEGKVVGLIAVSGGAMGGLAALNGLRDICRALHAWVVPEQAGVPQCWKNLPDPAVQKRLKQVGRQVAKFSLLHANKQAQQFLDMIEKAASNPGGKHDTFTDESA